MSIYSPTLPKSTHALRAFKVIADTDEIRNYFAVTFKNPWSGCDLYLRRLSVFGMIVPEYSGFAVDALDSNHDILETWNLTAEGLRYLRREWNLRMVPREKVDL